MRLTESIFRNIKEAESVKKPYGDKPQEGKKEKLERGKGKAVPKGKADNKFKVEKLENKNSQAAEIYPNDTAKYADKVDDKSHGDKGKIAKQNTKKASTTINKPFGDKIQASDSKLIKESVESDIAKKFANEVGKDAEVEADYVMQYCEEHGIDPSSVDPAEVQRELNNLKECDKTLTESPNAEGAKLLKQIYEQYCQDGMGDTFFDDVFNRMDISMEELQNWYSMDESAKVEECDGKDCK